MQLIYINKLGFVKYISVLMCKSVTRYIISFPDTNGDAL